MSCKPQLERHIQDPSDVLRYVWNWERWLSAGDSIADAVFLAPGLTVSTVGHDDTTATVQVSGGELCNQYIVTSRVVTAGGETKDWSIYLLIRQQ